MCEILAQNPCIPAARATSFHANTPRMMTDVVPSPTSSSCVRLSWIMDCKAWACEHSCQSCVGFCDATCCCAWCACCMCCMADVAGLLLHGPTLAAG